MQIRRIRNRYAEFSRRFAILIAMMFATNVFASAQSVPSTRVPEPDQSAPSDQSDKPPNKPPDKPSDDNPQPDQSPPDQTKDGNRPSLMTPLKPQTKDAAYDPITPRQRLRWFITNTIGPPHMVGGVFVSAFGTAFNRPKEYGPHWGGFADRYGMRMTGIVTGNAIEAGVGLVLHEDPRYFRVEDRPLKARIENVVRLTFVARREDRSFGPAYARYIAISGNNFLSNTWRVPGEANTQDALLRTAEGFAGRMVANAFEEFWPDFKQRVLHKRN